MIFPWMGPREIAIQLDFIQIFLNKIYSSYRSFVFSRMYEMFFKFL